MDIHPETGTRRRSRSNVPGTDLNPLRFQQFDGGYRQVPHISSGYCGPRRQVGLRQHFENREELLHSTPDSGQRFMERESSSQDKIVLATNAMAGRLYDSNIAESAFTVCTSHTFDPNILQRGTNSNDAREARGIANPETDIEKLFPYQVSNAFVPRPPETQLRSGAMGDYADIFNADLGHVAFASGKLAMQMQIQTPQDVGFPPARVCHCHCHSMQDQEPIFSSDRIIRAGQGVNTANDNVIISHCPPLEEQNSSLQNTEESRRSYSFQDPETNPVDHGALASVGHSFSGFPVSPGSSSRNSRQQETIPSRSLRHNVTRPFSSAAPTNHEQTGGASATWLNPTPGAAPTLSGFSSPSLGGARSPTWDEIHMLSNAGSHRDILSPSGHSSRLEVGTTGSMSSWTKDQSFQAGQQNPVLHLGLQNIALVDPRAHPRRKIPIEAQRRTGSPSASALGENQRSQRSTKRPSDFSVTTGTLKQDRTERPNRKRNRKSFTNAQRQVLKYKRGKVKANGCGCHQRRVSVCRLATTA